MEISFFTQKIMGSIFLLQRSFFPFHNNYYSSLSSSFASGEKAGGVLLLRRKRRKKKKPKDKYKGNLQQEVWSKDTVVFPFEILHRNASLSAADPEPRSISGCCRDWLQKQGAG